VRLINEDASVFDRDYPQILTGDMNAHKDNRAIQLFIEDGWNDTYEALHGSEDRGPTYHDFAGPNGPKKELGKIDWILYRGNADVLSANIVKDSENGRYPSDHYFVSAELRLR
jgi:endonuclease/exonuclease/phosphatase family metal-dependent hydrolase